jgi:arginyl-tRNA synthetase
MTVYTDVRAHVLAAVKAAGVSSDISTAAVTVEPPRDAAHGDLATNAAMVLGKAAGKPPRVLAEEIAAHLKTAPHVTSVDIAGPGFINMRLSDDFWRAQIDIINASGAEYGRSTVGAGQTVNVEYVSANPTGPMHMGHCRGAVVGDALAALLSYAGYKVIREYYINDAGSQVDSLARSAHLRYREALGENIGDIPEGFYPGDYLIPVGQMLAEKFGTQYQSAPESAWLAPFKKLSVDAMMDMIRADLAKLNIHHDVFSSEYALHENGKVDAIFNDLIARDLVYTGTLEKPKGDAHEEWEPVPLPLFRSSNFGDDADRPMKKSNGSWTYFGADTAYHCDKIDRGANQLVNIWGADHAGAIKRLKSAVAAITGNHVPLDIQIVQMVRLLKGGEPFKMSKRAGNFVTLADVVDDVGCDVVRFMMLTRKSDSQLDFDFDKVREQSKDNPVFYVQYAHARICSALKKATDIVHDVPAIIRHAGPERLNLLQDSEELAMVKLLSQWPRLVETAAAAHEPHRVAFYLADVAAGLHGLWNRGNDDPARRFVLADNPQMTAARSALLAAVAQVLKNGLGLMGVQAAEELRSDLP